MMKISRYIIYTAIVLVVVAEQSMAQQMDRPNNAVSIELGRTGLIVNLSYERLIIADQYGLRVDVGRSFGRYLSLAQGGIGAFVITGHSALTAEAGVDLHYISVDQISDDQNPGLGLVYPDYSVKQFCPAFSFGGRRYKRHSLFRLGLAGIFIDNKLVPGGYVSLGKTF